MLEARPCSLEDEEGVWDPRDSFAQAVYLARVEGSDLSSRSSQRSMEADAQVGDKETLSSYEGGKAIQEISLFGVGSIHLFRSSQADISLSCIGECEAANGRLRWRRRVRVVRGDSVEPISDGDRCERRNVSIRLTLLAQRNILARSKCFGVGKWDWSAGDRTRSARSESM